MSREYSLHSSLASVKAGDREDLLETLRCISKFDMDFSGENGTDYTWEKALENGFESDLEYLINEVKDIEDDRECVSTFIKEWIDNDSYYAECEVNCLTDEKGRVITIGFAAMCRY